jgi:multidrug efflux pump subunit AcrB
MKQENNNLKKEFGLTTWAVNNKTSVLLLTWIIAILGLLGYFSMPRESFPEVVIPNVFVTTAYPGNSPVDMENLVTRPIEKELKTISGVKKIQSSSIQDFSSILVEFNVGVNIRKALQDVKDAVDKSKDKLPKDLPKEPNVVEANFSEMPIQFINISGKYTLNELKIFGEYLEDEIEKLPEISKVDIKGAPEREIRIDADLFKMESRKVSFGDIEQAISSENITVSGGNLKAENFRRSIRIVGEFKSIEDIENVIIKSENGKDVYLRDVAVVKDSYAEPKSFARSRALPVITLNVVKRSGQNLINAADKIKAIIEKAQKERFPKDLKITITNDQSKDIRYMVSNLENSIIAGVILVVGVLLFFMGVRSALFVGIAIPMSMFMSFIILNMFGVTLNMMVLFSLILALGMLVDNGIVVVENIYRLMQEGYSRKRAIREGVGEIAIPIISSTATTVTAFLPMAFWPGVLGDFMKYLPITLIVVLASSLFVALIINPALAVNYAKLDNGQEKPTKKDMRFGAIFILLSVPFYFIKYYTIANLLSVFGALYLLTVFLLNPASFWFQNNVLVWLENNYKKLMQWALAKRKPYYILFGSFALFYFSIVLVGNSGLQILFFPANEPNYINLFIEKPIGTDIETTNEFTKKLEKRVMSMMKPYDFMIDDITTQVGEGTSDPGNGMPSFGSSPHKAKIAISFKEFEFRKGVSTAGILEMLREEVKNYAGVQIIAAKNSEGPPVGPPINIEVTGEDYEKLASNAEKLRQYIKKLDIPGIEELKIDLETGNPELLVKVDREKARRIGLSNLTIAMDLRTALFGKEISKYKEGEDDYPIQLRLADEQRYDVQSLKDKIITFNDRGRYKQIPISSVVDLEYSTSYGSIKRKNLDKIITLSSNVKEGYNANEIRGQLKNLLENYKMVDGYNFKFTGEQEEQDANSVFLLQSFLFALFAVFLIIVTQFNSTIQPLIIMTSVILSTIGVFLGLVIFRMEFVILMTGIGIISLAGVVVNNAIVLIDYTNLLRDRRKLELGLDEDEDLPFDEIKNCIAEAGQKRLRPVLLTAITTVLGLIPLAIQLNIDFIKLFSEFNPNIYMGGGSGSFFVPMAWSVIFGLTFATFLTLVVVPVMYLLSTKLKSKKKNKQKVPA